LIQSVQPLEDGLRFLWCGEQINVPARGSMTGVPDDAHLAAEIAIITSASSNRTQSRIAAAQRVWADLKQS